MKIYLIFFISVVGFLIMIVESFAEKPLNSSVNSNKTTPNDDRAS